MQNADIARALETIATLLEIRGEEHYRVLAYQRAAESVAASGRPVAELDDPRSLPHVGGTTARVIKDLAQNRTPEILAELSAEIPAGLVELTRLPGVGPRTAGRLWRELGVTSVEEVAALGEGSIAALRGFGKKSEESILRAARAHGARERRMLLDEATAFGERLLEFVRSHPAAERAEIAGSLRRQKETVGDLDIVAASDDPKALTDAFAAAPFVEEVASHGPTGASVVCAGGVEADLRVVSPEAFGSLLHHFTGSQAHNVALRERAVKRGLRISEYGLAGAGSDRYEPLRTEEELYARLGLPYIPPELREDTGEIEAAERGELPDPVGVEDIRGDLHVHTSYSDGKGTIESMAEAAIALGYEYLVFCDHSQSLRVANGLSPARLAEKMEAVRRADERYPEIHLLCGAEVDILRDGSLDYEDAVLAELDFVVASVHTAFRMDEGSMTDRIVRAMHNPHVRTIGHPTGRLLNRRDPYAVDVSRLIREAAATNTALELNAYPDRLDLSVPHAREAARAGVRLTIDTDAHDERALSFMRFGVSQARRAWVEKESVINCLPWPEFERYLRRGK
ncbi:PHP-like protein [Rubrobacter xylanophilus DSM 9941]|uniref:DNA-directed DNA polymerase n=1 Tax=Rubrobacter xylanophilus (strain DSM 9941 / JCM 11954 / NBRC 16129 / PRD-1) TaxID=266117 RepID=Q1AZH0_RUBXD|nr:DNA polymerase/3'-5' exonuclease PolX [Rubrobacter xylanophilus]ABG03208.1 PHP-like protein [Rubrobacter xylanophilus DSM 9941]